MYVMPHQLKTIRANGGLCDWLVLRPRLLPPSLSCVTVSLVWVAEYRGSPSELNTNDR